MDIIISGKNFKLTPSLKNYASDKFGKVAHFWSEIIRLDADMSLQKTKSIGEIFSVNVRLEVPGPDIKAEAEAADVHVAIDEVIEKLEHQISKIKGKYLDRRRSG